MAVSIYLAWKAWLNIFHHNVVSQTTLLVARFHSPQYCLLPMNNLLSPLNFNSSMLNFNSSMLGMKDLWCSINTVRLLPTQIWMGWRVCGALVQFSCYQHRYEWMLSPIHIRVSLELLCYYWCWYSVLGDLAIPTDSLSLISLGIGLSITFKGNRGSMVRAPAVKAGGPGFDSRWLPWVFSLPVVLY